MPPQQITIEPAPMEEVERMNIVVVREQEQEQIIEAPKRNSYTMKVDRRRNCYVYGRFKHIA